MPTCGYRCLEGDDRAQFREERQRYYCRHDSWKLNHGGGVSKRKFVVDGDGHHLPRLESLTDGGLCHESSFIFLRGAKQYFTMGLFP